MTRSASPAAKAYLGRVQALRFFAAFAVLFGHVQHEMATRLMPGTAFPQFTLLDGGIGVDVFFVISGFIMYHISADEFGRAGAARTFAQRRFLRVAPLYYLATLLILATIALAGEAVNSGQLSTAQIAASFLFIPYANEAGAVVPILKLGWTLNYEAYFYAMFTAALLFPRRIGMPVLFGGIVAVVALATALPGRLAILDFWGNSIVFEFLGGILVAMAFRRRSQIPLPAAWLLILSGIALAILLRDLGLYAVLPRAVFHGVPAALIVAGAVFGPLDRRRGPVMRSLERAGDASYALYLFHPFVIRATTVAWSKLHGPATPWLLIAGIIATTIAASIAINLLVEKPFDRWLRRIVGRHAAPLKATT